MKIKSLIFCVIFLILVLILLNFGNIINQTTENNPQIYFGIDVAYDDPEAIKSLVDEISLYTNTFVIGSIGITYNVTLLDEICNYVFDKGMYFMIYMHPNPKQYEIQRQWVENAKELWPRKFIGLYAHDEPGGRTLDLSEYRINIDESKNYTEAAKNYVKKLDSILKNIREYPINSGNLSLFTSDYALYWFDYEAGYDVVFAEFGWNYSRQLNIALC